MFSIIVLISRDHGDVNSFSNHHLEAGFVWLLSIQYTDMFYIILILIWNTFEPHKQMTCIINCRMIIIIPSTRQ